MTRQRLFTAATAILACGAAMTAQAPKMTITSSAFALNAAIPTKYTCDGANTNPALEFRSVPAGAKSLALHMYDPDVPKSMIPSGHFDHWLVWNLPATTKGIAEADKSAAVQGVNGMGKPGYMGPCPPDREHRYFFKLYALDTMLGGAKIANKADLDAAMKGHVLTEAELIGRYEKMKK